MCAGSFLPKKGSPTRWHCSFPGLKGELPPVPTTFIMLACFVSPILLTKASSSWVSPQRAPQLPTLSTFRPLPTRCARRPGREAENRSPRACESNPSPDGAAGSPSEGNDVKAQGQTSDDEESLDEVAMRAAEIHEVLQGLRDFRSRIVDGK